MMKGSLPWQFHLSCKENFSSFYFYRNNWEISTFWLCRSSSLPLGNGTSSWNIGNVQGEDVRKRTISLMLFVMLYMHSLTLCVCVCVCVYTIHKSYFLLQLVSLARHFMNTTAPSTTPSRVAWCPPTSPRCAQFSPKSSTQASCLTVGRERWTLWTLSETLCLKLLSSSCLDMTMYLRRRYGLLISLHFHCVVKTLRNIECVKAVQEVEYLWHHHGHGYPSVFNDHGTINRKRDKINISLAAIYSRTVGSKSRWGGHGCGNGQGIHNWWPSSDWLSSKHNPCATSYCCIMVCVQPKSVTHDQAFLIFLKATFKMIWELCLILYFAEQLSTPVQPWAAALKCLWVT